MQKVRCISAESPCHSSINITMNLHVHVTDDEKKKEVEKIEKMLNVV